MKRKWHLRSTIYCVISHGSYTQQFSLDRMRLCGMRFISCIFRHDRTMDQYLAVEMKAAFTRQERRMIVTI